MPVPISQNETDEVDDNNEVDDEEEEAADNQETFLDYDSEENEVSVKF